MTNTYQILFLGLSVSKKDFKVQMAHLGVSSETVDIIIEKAPVILKEGLDSKSSLLYADAVRNAGGIVEVQRNDFAEEFATHSIAIAPFKNFTMCPECGLKQQKRDVCIKCGFRFRKTENGLESENVAGH
jgi:hypothetical protein